MTIEIFCDYTLGKNIANLAGVEPATLPDYQSDGYPTEPPRLAI